MNDVNARWSGEWVAERLGVRLVGEGLRDLVGLAVRRNEKRAHLLVSAVLGKHVPCSPGVVYGTGLRLGLRVGALLKDVAGEPLVLGYAETATGLGHSVADGIVAAGRASEGGDGADGADGGAGGAGRGGGSDASGVPQVTYLHSTRRRVRGVAAVGGFEEEHSHATSHLLLPEDPELLAEDGPLVLVDDEFSTGRTVRNTIAALHRRFPRRRYVIAALVDMRSADDVALLEKFAAEIGARVDVVSLAKGQVALPDDVLERGRRLVAEIDGVAEVEASTEVSAGPPGVGAGAAAAVTRFEPGWPQGLPDGGRHGFTGVHRARLESALPHMAGRLAAALADVGTVPHAVTGGGRPGPCGGAGGDGAAPRVLVLGCEELMYAPLRVAAALEERLGDAAEIRFSTTTRSPVLAVDDPGYAIRTRIDFPAHDEDGGGVGDAVARSRRDDAGDGGGRHTPHPRRYAYNVASGSAPGHRFDAVVLLLDSTADTPALHAPDGLLAQLARHTDALLLGVLPSHVPLPQPLRGPDFSSYHPAEVGWLLQDMSDVQLEAPTEEREEAIQSGGAHYAESLPVEYQPSAEYQRLFHSALEDSAARIARAVGTVTETVLAERASRTRSGLPYDTGRAPVLVSLARAGTPVGLLMRRWAQHMHGLDLPHYAVSIVRGRGIDTTALRWLSAHHDPADVVFVDGWTGKGAITRELAAALEPFPDFDPELAVLADPGGCVRTYGTREDFLIPSACLNSTVSGLISRTVLRADLVGPDDFHGAKFYRELAEQDVSRLFVDTITARFDEVRAEVTEALPGLLAADRAPTWAGWRAVERISREYGIGDINLVKPGVGETTRVLLRRVPWKVLARRGAAAELDHVRLLSEQRGVPVEEVDELPYSCVGLIHPHFTRGATGTDGKAVV
jgi:pyrimidine operon attenuation protein/uracil phosphoribosyltransferase